MQISIIGCGYVGLVTGACFSEFGFKVNCIDNNKQKIIDLKNGIIPIYEPSLDFLVKQGIESGRLTFFDDLKSGVADSDIIMIAVGTPTNYETGKADLAYVYGVAKEVALSLIKYAVIVTKSTVPVGTSKQISQIILKNRPDLKIGDDFDVASNPEFLREGSAINDFMRPDRVVIGTESVKAKQYLEKLYRPLYLIETPIVSTKIETAELIKYAANGFLATKITFINQIADLCEKVGANVQDVAKGIGLDGRIGKKFLHAGPGYGGSCFPKDTLALSETAKEVGKPMSIIDAVINANDQRKIDMYEKIKSEISHLKNPKIAILGITFKPNTDDLRDAPSIKIIQLLLDKLKAEVIVYDPIFFEGSKKLNHAKEIYGEHITWAKNAYEAMQDADAVVIMTEWNEFRALDWVKIQSGKDKNFVVIDLRNVYKNNEMAELGIRYVSVGR
jgi:UDPglucose 6-dehydrogenase